MELRGSLSESRPGLGNAQCAPGAQAAHQFALKRTAPVSVEGLVNGFVRDALGFIVREVDLQPVGNLLR